MSVQEDWSEDDADPAEDAAEQFAALREEVAALQEAVEALPDTTPTLAVMARALTAMEKHPALQLTPQGVSQQLRAAEEGVRRTGEQALNQATQRVSAAAGELTRRLDQARSAELQNRRLLQVGTATAIGGAVLWAALSGPIARQLPASWTIPQKMAAATLGEDRWTAGEQLLQSADPRRWSSVYGSAKLATDNATAIKACLATARKSGHPQRCSIRVTAELSR